MEKTEDSLFDEIITTRITPDGTVEASLVEDAAQEMAASAQDMVKAWKDFKDASADYPKGACSYGWWKALVYLALSEDHLKQQFLGRDRSPKSIAQYHRWRLSLCDGRPYRANA
jgi:hypothetical protein